MDRVGHMTARSLPITNEKVIDILSSHRPWNGKILDLGAGSGYFSSLLAGNLSRNGCVSSERHIFACDLFPEEFKFDKVTCDFCDFNSPFPYKDDTFTAVCSIEIVEHLENVFHYAREVYRILQPGGVAVITTPNILNMTSRFRFFMTGFPLLFDPLPLSEVAPQEVGGHISPVSYYYLAYALKKAGFKEIRLHTDRLKNSAKFLLLFFYLPVKMFGQLSLRRFRRDREKIFEENTEFLGKINSLPLLLSRTVIIEAVK